MKKVELATALPGSCLNCGSADREYFIDLEFSLEFHGALYLCNLCVEEAANLSGYVSTESVKETLKFNEELKLRVLALDEKRRSLENSIGTLVAAGYELNSVAPELGDFDLAEQAASEGTGNLGSGEGPSAGSLHDETVGDLRSTESDSSDFTIKF